MNKKFSTLVAGILLAGSLPVAAQFCPTNGEVNYRTRLVKAATFDATFKDVNKINENYYYQLQVDPESLGLDAQSNQDVTKGYVLTVERDYSTGKLYLTAQLVTDATLTHSLWKIKVNPYEVSGRNFCFVNKETGFELTFDHSNAIQVNGTTMTFPTSSDRSGNTPDWKNFKSNYNWNYADRGLMDGCNKWWSWYTTDDQNTTLKPKKLYSYFHNTDSVMYLRAVKRADAEAAARTYNSSISDITTSRGYYGVTNGLRKDGLDGTADKGYAIVPVKDSKVNAQNYLTAAGSDVLKIQPVVAGAKVLNAAEINSMIDADGSYLNFADGIDVYDSWNEGDSETNRAGKTTKFTVCKPGSKELLSLATNPFNHTFRAIESKVTDYARTATGKDYAGYNILLETKDPIRTVGDYKEYGYLKVSENAYEGQAFQGIYNGLEVLVAPYAWKNTEASTVAERKKIVLQYKATEDYATQKDPMQARYHWKVTYYATNDSVVFEPLNASRMSQAEATAGAKYEETALWNATEAQYLNTVNKGNAYGTGTNENTMFNKAEGVPVALYAMNFGPSVGDVSAFLTVGYGSGVAADGSAVEASKDVFAAEIKGESGNPAYVTNKSEEKAYHSAMELTMRFANKYTPLKRATVKDGVYFINLNLDGASSTSALTEDRVEGANIVMDMGGHVVYDVAQDEQDFTHMPATQWVVNQKECTTEGGLNVNETPVVTIRNREFGSEDEKQFEGQLYADAHGHLFTINHRDYARQYTRESVNDHWNDVLSCNDKMTFTKLDEVNTLGYFTAPEEILRENVYQFQNIFDFGRYRYLGIDDLTADMDTLKLLEEGATEFELFPYKDWQAVPETYEYIADGVKKVGYTGTYSFTSTDSIAYGYANAKAGAPKLYAQGFKIKLKDTNLIDNDHRFVAINNQHKYVVAKESDIMDPANGLHFAIVGLKENNHVDGEHCYALVNATSYNVVNGYTEKQLTGLKRSYCIINSRGEYVKAKKENSTWFYQSGNSWISFDPETDFDPIALYWNDDNKDDDWSENEIRVLEDANANQVEGKLVIEGTTLDAKIAAMCETTSSVFALVQVGRPLYATLDAEYVNNLTKALALRTIDEQGNEYLYEDSHSAKAQRWNMNYLGVENRTEEGNEGFYVDFVAKSNARMPQYLFAVAADSVPAYTWCNELLPSGQPKHGVNPSCGHDEEYAGYTEGRFLVNYNDSIKKALIDKQTNADKFKSDGYTRLGFKTAVHRGDSLFILNEGVELNDYKVASEDPAENGRLYIIPTFFSKDNEGADKVWTAVKLDGTHNNVAFSLRNTGDADESVMIESNYDGESQIGSFSGAWIKIINNVPVLAKYYNNNGNHNTGDTTDSWKGENDRVSSDNNGEFINQGARFLFTAIDKNASATANEEVAAADVTVVAAQGAVIVKGAAGKVITVANVLGQTIANQVAASDNVTIAAPAGIVVVSVDGEATKVVVK